MKDFHIGVVHPVNKGLNTVREIHCNFVGIQLIGATKL